MAGPGEHDGGGPATEEREPGRAPTPMRGVWVAVAIVGGAAVVFLLLALTSGALNS